GTRYPHRRAFLVEARQSPMEDEGTYPLPEAQLDGFTMRLGLGYPAAEEEARMLDEETSSAPLDSLAAVSSSDEILAVADEAKRVFVEESINGYVVSLLQHTRDDPRLYLGAS